MRVNSGGITEIQVNTHHKQRDEKRHDDSSPPRRAGAAITRLSGLFRHILQQALFQLQTPLIILIPGNNIVLQILLEFSQLIAVDRNIDGAAANSPATRTTLEQRRDNKDQRHDNQQRNRQIKNCHALSSS